MSDGGARDEPNQLLEEVRSLRDRVRELQRAAARHEETDEISLAEREELLREAERVAHLGTWMWDIQSGRVSWSDEMFRILGLDPRTTTPSVEAFFAMVHPEDREQAEQSSQLALEDGILPPVSCRIVRPDGSIRQTTTSGAYLFDSAGKPRRMVGGVLDRTENLKVEDELRRTLALLEEAQQLAQVGSWRFDPDRGELEWSREFRRIAGLPLDAPADVETFLGVLVEDDRQRFRDGLDRIKDTPTSAIDGRIRRPDGSIRAVRLKGALVEGATGNIELRGTMLDVTDQVRLREELAHTQKMEAIGRLSAGIAHDFNNLLTVVRGNLEILQESFGALPELSDSLQAVSSATNLTRRLLAFGRKAQLSLSRVDPNQLVESTLTLMARLIGDEVRLTTNLGRQLPNVHVDPLEIERALVNLVVNARDAMPNGGLVSIASRSVEREGCCFVELSVSDEGPGIDEKDLPYIFEPFYSTRHGHGGTGLGLATVLGTAEQHGGTVRVESRKQGGATFTLVLPASHGRDVVQTGAKGVESSGPEQAPLRILVIDDEPMVARVTRKMLVALGHQVELATSPKEAEDIWRRRSTSIDLIVCDIVMAEMRGPALVERLTEGRPSPRVLFMSGYNEEATESKIGHPVLSKPFSSSSLSGAIRSVLG